MLQQEPASISVQHIISKQKINVQAWAMHGFMRVLLFLIWGPIQTATTPPLFLYLFTGLEVRWSLKGDSGSLNNALRKHVDSGRKKHRHRGAAGLYPEDYLSSGLWSTWLRAACAPLSHHLLSGKGELRLYPCLLAYGKSCIFALRDGRKKYLTYRE